MVFHKESFVEILKREQQATRGKKPPDHRACRLSDGGDEADDHGTAPRRRGERRKKGDARQTFMSCVVVSPFLCSLILSWTAGRIGDKRSSSLGSQTNKQLHQQTTQYTQVFFQVISGNNGNNSRNSNNMISYLFRAP